MTLHRVVGLLLALLGASACAPNEAPDAPASSATLTAADVADNNRGVGLMGSFDYPGARDAFAAVVERRPDWHTAKINLAIATLNLQTEDDERRALALAGEVLAAIRAHTGRIT